MSAVSRRFQAHSGIRSVERHFALVEFAKPTLGSLLIVSGQHSVRPNHLFDRNLDHDYFFELPARAGSGMPNHYGGDLVHTMGISGLSRVRTELLHFGVVPAAPPHPVQLDRQLPRHRELGDLPSTPQG